MKNSDGVIGRDLFSDAVDGSAATIKGCYVDGVDGISGVGSFEGVDTQAVPFQRWVSVDDIRETGLYDYVVDEGVVRVGAGVVIVVRCLVWEVITAIGAGEGDVVTFEVISEDASAVKQSIDVFRCCLVIEPIAVVFREFREYEFVFVNHFAVEVHVSCASIVAESGKDIGTAWTHDGSQRVVYLILAEWLFSGASYGIGVATVPGELTDGVAVVDIDGVAAHDQSSSVDNAITAFPFNSCYVVRYSELFFDECWERVVEGSSGIVFEVDHSNAVVVAIVEAYRTAVAEPKGVARADDESHFVVAQSHCLKSSFDDRAVRGVFDSDPSFSVSHLNSVHQVEEYVAEAIV